MAKRPTWYKHDLQLSARMLLTMFLLGAVYLAFLFFLWYLHVNIIILIVLAAVILGVQFFFADKIALFSMQAREVSEAEAPQLHALINRLAAQANLPKPRVAIVNTNLPNAFATGRSKRSAVVAVTTGLLDRLNTQELEAVLAHELTHIVNRDMFVMTVATFLAMVASLLSNSLMWGAFMGGGGYGRRSSRDNEGGAIILVVWLVSLLVYAISFVLIRALSRYREYAADRGSALITGAPENLASALMRIEGTIASGRIPDRDLRQAQGVSALMIMPALRGESAMEIFSTHPSLEHRVERLQRMQRQMESAS
ncbi:MAG TPA: zinc metalloprotease HtpX [Ktedonobacterales bacterium]|nr:zinc metalloprotease HtpX [Ktedonobacterales bacterium]